MTVAAAIGLAALAGASIASAATASPAALPIWNLAYQTHGGPNQLFVTITAPTKKDAWAAGNTTNVPGAAGYPTGSVFAHWNGHSWTAASIETSGGFIAEHAYSSSPSNVWIFGRARNTNAEEALIYNGKTWSSRVLPGMIDDSNVALLSPSDVWAGTDQSCPPSVPTCTLLIHWNGKAWQTVKIPGHLRAVTAAAGRAWFFALAPRHPGTKNTASTPVLYRVTGSKIGKVKAPSAGLIAGTGIVAAPSGQVWLLAKLASTGHREALFHWNGTAWKGAVVPASVCPPNASGYCPLDLSGTLSYDGEGGFWCGWYTHWSGKQWQSANWGHGTRLRNGYSEGASVAIPGTHSVWGVGGVSRTLDSAVTNGLVAIYGPLP